MTSTRNYRLQPPRPSWGIRAPTKKAQSTNQGIRILPAPERCHVPIEFGTEGKPQLLVEVGEKVLTGQAIARTTDGLQTHASISGSIGSIGPRAIPGPDHAMADCVEIIGDGQDRWHPACVAPELDGQSAADIRAHIAAAGIVGLGGALFSTAAKLATPSTIHMLILNGTECEPYISCDEMLLRERPLQVLQGARIMLRALGAKRAVVAIESDMPEARVAIYDAAADMEEIDVAVVTAKYPAGGERQLIELLTEAEVPIKGLPKDVGYLCQNVATSAAVAEYFATGKPLISRIVTVTGGAMTQALNMEARIGTSLETLIEAAGGFDTPPATLIMGGPMMGHTLPHARLPVTKATNCIIAADATELNRTICEYPCIRCAECSDVCPARLMPQFLLSACESHNTKSMEELNLESCIECGCCDFVCPSHIALTQKFIASKRQLRHAQAEKSAAKRARERALHRDARLSRKSGRQAAELARQDARLSVDGDASQTELAQLIARSNAKDKTDG